MTAELDIKKGLQGVIADTSAVSQVIPETSTLTYRGYTVGNLCEQTSFEEVCYLLLYNELPTASQLKLFMEKERAARELPHGLMNMLEQLPRTCHPMDSVRSFVSLYALYDETLSADMHAFTEDMVIRLLGATPVFVAWDLARRSGRQFTAANAELSFSANFFNMAFGSLPAAEVVRAFDVSLILYAEHSFNASTFTSRVITSTQSDYYSAITGAIAALKGPLHGGANEAVMKMFQTILQTVGLGGAEQWIRDALACKTRIMGFGHRVYRTGDSRVPTMEQHFFNVAQVKQDTELVKLYKTVADVVVAEKGIHPNLDYPSAPAYYLMGFMIDFFTPIFVMSRIAGWSAHIIEQRAANRLIRPICAYTGPARRAVVPIAKRS